MAPPELYPQLSQPESAMAADQERRDSSSNRPVWNTSLAIVLSPTASRDVLYFLRRTLRKAGLDVKSQLRDGDTSGDWRKGRGSGDEDDDEDEDEDKDGAPAALVVRASRAELQQEAVLLRLIRRNKRGRMVVYSMKKQQQEEDENEDEFPPLTPAEEMYLLQSIVDNVQGEDRKAFVKLLDTLPDGVGESVLHVSSQVRALLDAEAIDNIMPLHSDEDRMTCWQNSCNGWGLPDLHAINEYFGPSRAFYFAWLVFYLKWLSFPACLGLLLSLHRVYVSGKSVDDDEWAPLFTLAVIFWSAGFQKYWKRTSSEWAWRWGTLLESNSLEVAVRPEFEGALVTSFITGRQERYFSRLARLPRYMVSVAVTGLMLCLAAVALMCCLNLEGYTKNKNWLEQSMYIEQLASLTSPGGVLDPEGVWLGFIPKSLGSTIVHVLVIQSFNKIYRTVATKLTNYENHRTQEDWEQALLVKRFLFEAFDAYVCLFYIAFFQFEITRLRSEILSLYMVDSFRRVFLETVLPVLLQSLAAKDEEGGVKEMIKKKASGTGGLAVDLQSDEYEAFDDYLEMIIQFGYVTLFASAFPLAALVSVLATYVEIKSDHVHLTFVFRRPPVERTATIGAWAGVMDCMCWLSVLTNCLLFGLTSEQMMQWMPELFRPDEVGVDQDFESGMGRYAVGLCFGLEHVIFIAILILWNYVPDKPEWVQNEVRRFYYEGKALYTQHPTRPPQATKED